MFNHLYQRSPILAIVRPAKIEKSWPTKIEKYNRLLCCLALLMLLLASPVTQALERPATLVNAIFRGFIFLILIVYISMIANLFLRIGQLKKLSKPL